MGESKMLLRWGEGTVLSHLVTLWAGLTEEVAVVIASQDGPIAKELDGLPRAKRIMNPWRERGMISSIQCAAAWDGWSEALTHFAIVLGDQPNLSLRETLVPLLELAEANPQKICQPSLGGRAKHPVIFPRAYFEQIRQSSTETLKEFLGRFSNEVIHCASDDAALDLDLDVPADYHKAHAASFGEAAS